MAKAPAPVSRVVELRPELFTVPPGGQVPDPVPHDADMLLLFIDSSRVPVPDTHVEGVVGDTGDYALEPGALFADIRTSGGSIVRIVMNRNSSIVLPGSSEPTAATGAVGDIDDSRPQVEAGMRFSGSVREFELRGVESVENFPWRLVVRGTFSR